MDVFGSKLDIVSVLRAFERDPLTATRAQSLKEELLKLPPTVKIFLKPNRISCDVVIVKDNKPHFIEYHEHQHYALSNNRLAKVYSLDDQPISVPRYVQRFLRDVWRLRTLHPFYIVSDEKFQHDGLSDFNLSCNTYMEFCADKKEFFARFCE